MGDQEIGLSPRSKRQFFGRNAPFSTTQCKRQRWKEHAEVSHLSKLNITQLKRRAPASPVEQRRTKLIVKLEEQLALARAQSEGKSFVVTKMAWRRDADGNKTRVEREKQVRPWWWKDGDGLSLVVRYGAKQIDLAKGRKAISIAQPDQLPAVLSTLVAAVAAGELDGAIESAVTAAKAKPAKG